MIINFYINWNLGETRSARKAREQKVTTRLKAAGIPYTFESKLMGGNTYTINQDVPASIARLVTVLNDYSEE